MGRESRTLLGILAGTAIGATLGILFAPDKGSNTRKKIADEATAARDKISEKAHHLRDNLLLLSSQIDVISQALHNISSDELPHNQKDTSAFLLRDSAYSNAIDHPLRNSRIL